MFTRKPITCENTKTRRETDMMRTYFLHVGLVAAILATSITHCASAQASELEVSGSRLACQRSVITEMELARWSDGTLMVGNARLYLASKHGFWIDPSLLSVLRKTDRVLVCEDAPASTVTDACYHDAVIVNYDANRIIKVYEGPHGTLGRNCGDIGRSP